MNTLKQEALTAISQLPATADVDTIIYKLYVIDKVMKEGTPLKRVRRHPRKI